MPSFINIVLPAVLKSSGIPFLLASLLLILLGSFAGIRAQDFSIDVSGAIAEDDSVQISWHVDCFYENAPDSVVIRYNRSAVLASEGEIWQPYVKVPYAAGKINLGDLNSASEYVYQLGYSQPDSQLSDVDGITWSSRHRFTTKLPWGVSRFLLMIGALCLFIYGMKTMSEGIQASAGARLRRILNQMTRNRFTGVVSGFGLTGILQSSSATTVMVVSFVNAGLITLTESAGVMMGANIGTTVTGWLVSYLGFRGNITFYTLIIFAFATPLLLSKKTKIRSWSTAIIGFALLLMGLSFIKSTVPTFTENSALVKFFVDFQNIPLIGTLMFVALGAIVTIIIQSSSTAITLTMALCVSGVIPLDAAAGMILGENIGTTITAEIAALVGNVHAKRSARIHTLFNLIGVTWMVFLLPFVLKAIGTFLPVDPFENSEAGRQSATTALAAFHSVFNFLNLFLLIWFVPQLVKLATRTVRSKGGEDEEFRLEFIKSSIPLSEISLLEAKKELVRCAKITAQMSKKVKSLLTETDPIIQQSLYKQVRKYEKITDKMEVEIAEFCSRLARTELSKEASERVRSMLSISSDLERIGDVFYQMSNTMERKTASKIWFTPGQREKLAAMFDVVEKAISEMIENLSSEEGDSIDLKKAQEHEERLDDMRDKLKAEYLQKVESGKYNFRNGTIYNDLFTSLAKVGDHTLNVSEAISGKI
jgi:phosphate:Na+ symporter